MRPEIDMKAIAVKNSARWPDLARQLGLSAEDIDMVAKEPLPGVQTGPEADYERCEHMLALWTQRSAASGIKAPEDLGN